MLHVVEQALKYKRTVATCQIYNAQTGNWSEEMRYEWMDQESSFDKPPIVFHLHRGHSTEVKS